MSNRNMKMKKYNIAKIRKKANYENTPERNSEDRTKKAKILHKKYVILSHYICRIQIIEYYFIKPAKDFC